MTLLCVVCDNNPRANCEFCIHQHGEEVKQMSENTMTDDTGRAKHNLTEAVAEVLEAAMPQLERDLTERLGRVSVYFHTREDLSCDDSDVIDVDVAVRLTDDRNGGSGRTYRA